MVSTIPENLQVVVILTAGFCLAALFGSIAQKLKLSSILGYLLAGYMIGPFSPGFVADIHVTEQLAEIGVILMMFGVGIHFKIGHLLNVRNIAIPGAIGQTIAATFVGATFVHFLGWPWSAGIVLGLCVAVASTVVLVKALTDNHILHTPQGHAAIGWLIVEDILTVFALIILPAFAFDAKGEFSFMDLTKDIAIAVAKFALLAVIMFTVVAKLSVYLLKQVALLKSQELFTLSVLALTFGIATGSALFFGASIALGAFIAGMILGHTKLRERVSVHSLPIKDTFAVIFFLTIGMLFNPVAIYTNFPLFIVLLMIILVIKPLAAWIIVRILKYPTVTALTIAAGLAQIGEFSFILGEEASRYNILPDEGYDLLVACSMISIALNPFFFKWIDFNDPKVLTD